MRGTCRSMASTIPAAISSSPATATPCSSTSAIEHLSRYLETIDEVRPAKARYHMAAVPDWRWAATRRAAEFAALVGRSGVGQRRLA
jgi:hypothetical protein